MPGHMFYVIADDISRHSFGFAPVEHGSINGPGKTFDNDEWNYIDPHYARTLEISADQFEKLKTFGEKPNKFGFDMAYRDARNNCVDFTWAALHRAGIHPVDEYGKHRIHFEGNLRPTRNIDPIRSIVPPVPDSPHNTETINPLPKRQTFLQRTLTGHMPSSQKGQPGPGDSIDDMFERLYRASVAKDHVTEREVGRAFAQTDAGRAMFAEASLMNDRQDLVEQQRALEAQRADMAQVAPQQRAHVMSM